MTDWRTDIVKVEQYSALAEFPKKEILACWISQNFSLFFGVHWELVWFLDWKEYDVGDDNSPFIIHVIKNGFVVCTQWMIHAIKFVSSVRSSNSHPDLLLIHHHQQHPHFFRSHRSSTLDFHFLSHYGYIKGNHWTCVLATCIPYGYNKTSLQDSSR